MILFRSKTPRNALSMARFRQVVSGLVSLLAPLFDSILLGIGVGILTLIQQSFVEMIFS